MRRTVLYAITITSVHRRTIVPSVCIKSRLSFCVIKRRRIAAAGTPRLFRSRFCSGRQSMFWPHSVHQSRNNINILFRKSSIVGDLDLLEFIVTEKSVSCCQWAMNGWPGDFLEFTDFLLQSKIFP